MPEKGKVSILACTGMTWRLLIYLALAKTILSVSPVIKAADRTLSASVPPSVAFVVLCSGQYYPLIGSLIQRYQKAFEEFTQVKVIVALSCPRATYAETCDQIAAPWFTALGATVEIAVITTDLLAQNFPALAPFPRVELSPTSSKPFEWAHHEPTLLSCELKLHSCDPMPRDY